MSIKISFEELRRCAEKLWPMPVKTSLLGAIPYHEVDGELVALIPDWITEAAQEHRLTVVTCDFRSNVYVLKLVALPPLKTPNERS